MLRARPSAGTAAASRTDAVCKNDQECRLFFVYIFPSMKEVPRRRSYVVFE
jgi:hypothetical protein